MSTVSLFWLWLKVRDVASVSEGYAAAEEVESGAAEHVSFECFDLADGAFDSAAVAGEG
ncbi:hypothetical protein [Amycolatopsis rubida]|uniref:hypothetical protein n=1 Tax=Amycolatopsis rubida TaxID=112413 RepID=UPI00142F347D|nr:hypothetical protein [Amycolatopsis rubida]